MQGLVVFDYAKRFPEAWADLSEWILSGELKFKEDIDDGIACLPAAFVGLFKGENFGRKLVRLAD